MRPENLGWRLGEKQIILIPVRLWWINYFGINKIRRQRRRLQQKINHLDFSSYYEYNIDAIWKFTSGCGSVWLEHLLWEQGVAGSNPATPTTFLMFFVYILQSSSANHFYIGSTNNLIRRFHHHQINQVKSTKIAVRGLCLIMKYIKHDRMLSIVS